MMFNNYYNRRQIEDYIIKYGYLPKPLEMMEINMGKQNKCETNLDDEDYKLRHGFYPNKVYEKGKIIQDDGEGFTIRELVPKGTAKKLKEKILRRDISGFGDRNKKA